MTRAKKGKPQIRTERLPVRLKDSERLQKGLELARLMHHRLEAEAENRARQAEWRLADKEAEEAIGELARDLHAGTEERDVEIEVRTNWAEGTIEVYRLDTGEQLSKREMSAEERQVSFDDVSN